MGTWMQRHWAVMEIAMSALFLATKFTLLN